MAATLSASPPDSHLGQKVSDLVTLRILRNPPQAHCDTFAERVLPGGETRPLEMSARWFVVTDVTWRTIVGPGFPGQQPGLLTLRVFLPGEAFPSPFFESSALLTADAVADPVFKSEHLTAGFVVAAVPCVEFAQIGREDGGVSGTVILHGDLINRPIQRE